MKKWLCIVLLLLIAGPALAQNREAQILNQYRILCTQEKEAVEILEEIRAKIQKARGTLAERRMADKEIAVLEARIKGLEEQREETLKKELENTKEIDKTKPYTEVTISMDPEEPVEKE